MRYIVPALLILTFTTSVYAECSWILWERRQQTINGEFTGEWEPKAGYPASSQGLLLCMKVMKQSIAHTKKFWEESEGKDSVAHLHSGIAGGEESVALMPLSPTDAQILSYRCLPDTIKHPERGKKPAK